MIFHLFIFRGTDMNKMLLIYHSSEDIETGNEVVEVLATELLRRRALERRWWPINTAGRRRA